MYNNTKNTKVMINTIATIVIMIALLIYAMFTTYVIATYINNNNNQLIYNVAIYEDDKLIDEDGDIFVGDYNLEEGGTYYVGYTTNNTATRLDDVPTTFEALD